jgi:prepilin-type N-terminal cleavage/methylation domain-containing protein
MDATVCRLTDAQSAGAQGNEATAFTLIEIMVAVSILAILVLIMSTIFHQSSLAWDSGTGRMKANVAARSLMNFMERELTHAVADSLFFANIDSQDDSKPTADKGYSRIRFWSIEGTNSTSERLVRRIEYWRDDAADTLIRSEWRLHADEQYGPSVTNKAGGAADSQITLAENVTDLRFQGWPETGQDDGFSANRRELPNGVKIMLALKRSDRVSNVAAWSFGPDGQEGSADDIKSW